MKQTGPTQIWTENVGGWVSSFIRSFSFIVMGAIVLASAGLIMKLFAITAGNFLFVFSMAFLSLLFLVQVGLSFFYVLTNVRLTLIGAVSSVALVLGFLGLIFRFQTWEGWQILFIIALPASLLSLYFIVRYFSKPRATTRPQQLFLYRNLLLPYVFMFALIVASFALDLRSLKKSGIEKQRETPAKKEASSDQDGMWKAY